MNRSRTFWQLGVRAIVICISAEAVDVDDLLSLIGAWGPCAAVVCAPDLTGGGAVDIDDLLVLLNRWGGCPAPAP